MTARPTRADLRAEVDHLRELIVEKDAEIRALEATLHIEKAAHNLVWDLYRSAEAEVTVLGSWVGSGAKEDAS